MVNEINGWMFMLFLFISLQWRLVVQPGLSFPNGSWEW